MHFVGIDIGTSSISGVAYSTATREVESVTRPNDANIPSAYRWEKTQDPARILEIVRTILDDFSVRYPTLQGVGLTGQMHGIVYLGANGDAISPLYTWQDGRANLQFGYSDTTYALSLSELTGYTVASGYAMATHFYNSHNGLVPEGATRICTIADYVAMKLVGRECPVTDPTNAAGLGLFDVEHCCFDWEALKLAGIDETLLPELVESSDTCGNYRGIPVYVAIGDNQAAFLGSVRNLHRTVHITIGTSSQLSVFSERYFAIPGLETRPFPRSGYMFVGAALCGGHAFAILRSFFEDVVRKFGYKPPQEQECYTIMTDIDYEGSAVDLPVVETLFDGTRFTPSERGKIENISSINLTPDNLIIGFLKGISKELYQFYRALPNDIAADKSVLVGSGNALKMNTLLCRVLSEQFNTEVEFSSVDEEAAFGACLNAIAGFDANERKNVNH